MFDRISRLFTGCRVRNAIRNDDECVALWLASLGRNSREAYRNDYRKFCTCVLKSLQDISVADLLRFVEQLEGAESTRARAVNAVRSLFTFGVRSGYLQANPMSALKLRQASPIMGEKYLGERDVSRLMESAEDGRDRLLLQVLYFGGLRVSEICGLRWRDLTERKDLHGGVQLSVRGKGNKVRRVVLPEGVGQRLLALRGDGADAAPVFASRQGGALGRTQVFRVIKTCASKAGLPTDISPHSLRHAHATHAIEHGVPLHVVQKTLGHQSLSTTGMYLHARPNESSGMYLKKGG